MSLALVAGSVTAAVVATAQNGDDAVLLSNDFEGGSFDPWGPRGDVTLAIVDEAHGGSHSLSVTGRTANWNGTAIDAMSRLSAGVTYSITGWAKLPTGTPGTTGIHFTVQHRPAGAPSDGSGDQYDWVGGSITTSADSWVQIGGDYTFPADQSAATLYVEAEGATTPFLLDDILITGPPSAPPVTTVSAVNFEDGTTGTWTQSGGGSDTLTVVDGPDGGKVLSVNNRDADFVGIQSPTGLFQPGKTYTLSMKARLASGTAGSAGVRFVMKPQFEWIGNTTMTADGWTTVTADWTAPGTAPAGTDPATLQVYIGTANLDPNVPYTYLIDDILVTTPLTGPPPGIISSTDFENGLNGWVPRQGGPDPQTVEISTDFAHSGTHSVLVTDRHGQGDGIGLDVTSLTQPGVTYQLTAWVRFAPGQATDAVWLSLARTTGGATTFSTLGQFNTVTNTGFTQIQTSFSVPAADSALLYFETSYQNGATGNTSDLYFDDITVEIPPPAVIQPLTPIKDTVDFPVGVAIDSRETTGDSSQLLLRHFDQVTPENHFKPDAWYDADHNFGPAPDAVAIMNFAQANHLRVYGHTLVWYQQTPDWFFEDDQGNPLQADAAGQAIATQRLHDHIFNVANWLATNYGPFGSASNPLVAFDVVNEAVADSTDNPDGLRTNQWYQILGANYINLAFQFANQAFNIDNAASGSVRPVKLFINDYNSEQGGKQDRYYALVQHLLDQHVPVDGVGHQFHLSIATPVSSLGAALDRFANLPVLQAVTEFDVTLPTPVTQAEIVEQGYFYRDAFAVFRAHDMFSVTVWGIDDARSWRSTQDPTIFDGQLQAKPAYYGIADPANLPPHLRTANVFQGDVALNTSAFDGVEWRQLPPIAIGDAGSFGVRWNEDHLTALVSVASDSSDAIQFEYGSSVLTFHKDGTGDVSGVVDDTGDGWRAIVHLPHSGVTQGSTGTLDVRVLDGSTVVAAWNSPGALGTLSFIEPLSYLEVVQARQAPVIDGTIDGAWADANTVQTDTLQAGDTDGATANVRTLWQNDTLYVLAEVTDPNIDVSSSNAYEQDSVELFIDPGNAKNGSYRDEDAQMRINVNNVHSFGTGDAAAQESRLRSATKRTDTGYVVEAAVTLLGHAGLGTFQGLDFQVNDGTAGARTSVRSWAEPTGTGYQTTARWGVGQLVGPTVAPWSASKTYNLGDWVTYQGSFWLAQWSTKNQKPGDPYGPWEQIATADDGTSLWTASRVFTQGDGVLYQGHTYIAQWWTRNQVPGNPTGPWAEVATAPDGTALWTPTGVYNTGDVVEYQGEKYRAQWWNRNQPPGQPNGPWQPIV
ncbi:MAG TPA: endo-1,4-beta-xylanase [Micromonosporaceae bacterium]